ncbi:hypothetical protein M8J76_001213 [Diaphorina citri]|nr:hypothetical protein M8J75_007995 [Diaphorina citri]KAI5729308.1 hypothetical protein M8J76_001213 [Diaphorina citri]
MDFSDRRYSKPKVLKKRKDLNKYKLRSVNSDKLRQVPQETAPVHFTKQNHGNPSSAAPGITKINRTDRLTVKRGLFQKSQKSKVACRGLVNRSEQVARLNEDLDAIIPSGNDVHCASPSNYPYEQNNNIPAPLNPEVEVIWETQPDVNSDPPTPDSKPLPHPALTNHNGENNGYSKLLPHQPTSTNQVTANNRHKSHPQPALSNHSTANGRSRSRSSRHKSASTRLSDPRIFGSPGSSVDPYPRTRAYVNAQRERIAKYGTKAFQLSSESENEEHADEPSPQSRSHEHWISKYIELIGFVEKRFSQVKQKVFKDSPCNDYFKSLRNELWSSYKNSGRDLDEGSAPTSPLRAGTTGQTCQETGPHPSNSASNSSELEDTPMGNLDQEPAREFVFSPNLSQLPHPTRSPQEGALFLFPHKHIGNQSEADASDPAQHFHSYPAMNSSPYDDTGWKPSDFAARRSYLPENYRYHDNHTYSPSWSHRPQTPVRSPGLSSFHNRGFQLPSDFCSTSYSPGYPSNQRPSNYSTSYSPGFPLNQRPSDYDSTNYSPRFVSNQRPPDYGTSYRFGSQDSEQMSLVSSANSGLRGDSQPRDSYRMRPNGLVSVITISDDEDESPPMKFYPRKLF